MLSVYVLGNGDQRLYRKLTSIIQYIIKGDNTVPEHRLSLFFNKQNSVLFHRNYCANPMEFDTYLEGISLIPSKLVSTL